MIHKLTIRTILTTCILFLSINSVAVNAQDLKRSAVYDEIGKYLDVPDSYTYIDLYYSDINSSHIGFGGLQKLVYTGKIENKVTNVFPDKLITKSQLYTLLTATGDKNLDSIEYLQSGEGFADEADLDIISNVYGAKPKVTISASTSNIDSTKLQILNDVYDTLNMNHIDSDNFEDDALINSAIDGLARGTDDSYTSYFPPAENKSFQEGLQGEYEGIGAYVDMPEPGVVLIVSPITGSPAEKAGLRGGDIIYSVDGIEVGENESLTEVTSKIKGPAGTEVLLGILRDGEKLEIPVTRGKIVIADVVGEEINSRTYYIQMKMFTGSIGKQFTTALEMLESENKVDKIIIDLRNNPGGYLDQVVDILGHFIPEGEPVAVVKYKNSEQSYTSFGYDTYDFTNKEIVILINSGTASASEILTGTLKDYFPDQVTVIGETSFGKGSVQTQRYYLDGSALKYTIAKWYTGKTEIGIDGIGIVPDIEVEFDRDRWEEKEEDTQLLEAINL